MAENPLNLALRFFLEIAALFIMGWWGWHLGEDFWRIPGALAVPMIAAGLWGTFRVPDDPGKAPVAIPGWLRLLLEGIFFGFSTWALATSGRSLWAMLFGALIVLHYALAYDRVRWLIKG